MAFSLSRNERLYLQIQSAFGTIPNSAGASSVAVANYCRHKKLNLNAVVGLLNRPDKTGSRSATPGVLGRKSATWTLDASLASQGTAGQAPPCDPVLQALFGQAGSALTGSGSITGASNAAPIVITQTAHGFANGDVVFVSGVGGNTAANGAWVIANVTANAYDLVGSTGSAAYTSGGTGSRVGYRYAMTDFIPSLVAYSFLQPAGAEQRAGFGLVVQEATFNLGQDVADWQAQGEGKWVLDSHNFSGADSEQKGGLTSFPAEPAGTLLSDGGIVAGFTGRAVLNGATIANIRTATLKVNTGNAIVKDTFGSYYPDSAEGDERNVSLSFSLHHADDASTKALYAAALSKAALEMILQVGTVAGNIWIFHLKGVQLNVPALDDGQRRYVRSYSDCRATGTSPTALDELRLTVI